MPGYAQCFHCLIVGHWQSDCPLLIKPADKTSHEERLAEFTRRFTEQEIGPIAKRKMIKKENSLWKEKQREMARQ